VIQSENPTFFITPILDRYLLYAPLQRFAMILESDELERLKVTCDAGLDQVDEPGASIVPPPAILASSPRVDHGTIKSPLFLGLITTRKCNMGCKYCDFVAPVASRAVMKPEMARAAVDAYLRILAENKIIEGQIQFFGGEPFFQNAVVEFVHAYAREKSKRSGISLRFSVTTNGLMAERRAMWVADNFDTVVLSLDGAAYQDLQRPLINGSGSYNFIHKTAQILSEGKANLIIRVCVTSESVMHLPALALDLANAYVLNAVCFEPLTESNLSQANCLFPPDPVRFARQFCLAEDILAPCGIETVVSGTDISSLERGFCPVGQDALIFSPEGDVSACYLMESDWVRAGLDLKFGKLGNEPGDFYLDLEKIESLRRLARNPAPLCDTCLCRYHCAGGCHVNHASIRKTNQYDSVCIRTRLVTVGKLLRQMGKLDFYYRWLDELS
jgi:uncharacterized protein